MRVNQTIKLDENELEILTKKNAYDDLKVFFECEYTSSVSTAAAETLIEGSKGATGKRRAQGEWDHAFQIQYYNKDFTKQKNTYTVEESLFVKASWTVPSADLATQLRNLENIIFKIFQRKYFLLTLTRPLRRKLRISADSSLIRQKIKSAN